MIKNNPINGIEIGGLNVANLFLQEHSWLQENIIKLLKSYSIQNFQKIKVTKKAIKLDTMQVEAKNCL